MGDPAVLDRVDYFFARCLAGHLHPPAFSGTVVIAKPKCPELINTCTARATAVQYRRRGADVAGYRGRGARARRVDHAYAPSPPEGARRSEAKHSSCVAAVQLSRKECEHAAAVKRLWSRKCLRSGNEYVCFLQTIPTRWLPHSG